MSLCCVTTAPRWPGHTTRRGSSCKPSPLPAFSCCWKPAPLGGLLHGLPEFAGSLFLSVMPSCLPSLPLPLPPSSRRWGGGLQWSQAKKVKGSGVNDVSRTWTIVESNAGQEKATSYWNDSAPPHPHPFLVPPLSVLNRNCRNWYSSHDFPRRPQLVSRCRWETFKRGSTEWGGVCVRDVIGQWDLTGFGGKICSLT